MSETCAGGGVDSLIAMIGMIVLVYGPLLVAVVARALSKAGTD